MSFFVIPHDKALHAFYFTFIYAIVVALGYTELTALYVVSGGAASKEVYDYFVPNHTASWLDYIASVAPSTIVYMISKGI